MKYQKIIQALDRILYLIGKHWTSYQGKQKTVSTSDTLWNPENFLSIVGKVKHRYLLLDEHIHSALWKDFLYMSSTSQNKLIRIVTKYTI